MNRILAIANERMRRLLAGFFAGKRDAAASWRLERITGIDRNTIAKGLREVSQAKLLCPTGSADTVPGRRLWRRLAGGREGLGDPSADTARRSDHWPEMDASFVAEALQGPSASGRETVATDSRTLDAANALLSAHLLEATGWNSQSGPGPPVSFSGSFAKILHNSWLASN